MHYNLPNFIIGGAPKSGTSSLFNYLSEHPEVCASTIKETAFFINNYTGNIANDRERYSRYFSLCHSQKIIMEGSAGYLGYGPVVAERMANLLQSPKILFILRNPVDRFRSYFNYRKSMYAFPDSLTLDEYYNACLSYQNNRTLNDNDRFTEYDLLALEHGKYVDYLPEYFRWIGPSNVLIMFYDDLKEDERAFVMRICDFIGIDRNYYNTYSFRKVNETIKAKSAGVHKIAIKINTTFEPFFRKNMKIKRFFADIYRKVNILESKSPQLALSGNQILWEYYARSIAELRHFLEKPSLWLKNENSDH